MTILYIVIAILFFGILIAVHELGHFSVAKWCGIRVDEFAIGMGPVIMSKQKGETLYSWRAIPFGGFCAMGEDEGNSDDPRAFVNKSVWKRALVLIAGSFNNFVLGFLIILILVLCWNIGTAGLGAMVAHSWNVTIDLCKLVWESLGMLFHGEVGINDLSGPVGIVDVMADVATESPTMVDAFSNLAYFGAFIAVNLAIMNMLPIPALDGGRVFTLIITGIIEAITKKKLDPKYEAYIHTAGMIILLAVMAYVMFHDVFKIIFGGGM